MPLSPDQSGGRREGGKEGRREGGDRRTKIKRIKNKLILKETGVFVFVFFFSFHPKACPAYVSKWGAGLPGIIKPLPSQIPFKLHKLQQTQILCLAPLLHFSLHQLQQQCQWLSTAPWQGFPGSPSPGASMFCSPAAPRMSLWVTSLCSPTSKVTQGQAGLWI